MSLSIAKLNHRGAPVVITIIAIIERQFINPEAHKKEPEILLGLWEIPKDQQYIKMTPACHLNGNLSSGEAPSATHLFLATAAAGLSLPTLDGGGYEQRCI